MRYYIYIDNEGIVANKNNASELNIAEQCYKIIANARTVLWGIRPKHLNNHSLSYIQYHNIISSKSRRTLKFYCRNIAICFCQFMPMNVILRVSLYGIGLTAIQISTYAHSHVHGHTISNRLLCMCVHVDFCRPCPQNLDHHS